MKQGGCLGNLTAPECGLYLRLGGAMMACEVFLSQVMMMGGGALMWTAYRFVVVERAEREGEADLWWDTLHLTNQSSNSAALRSLCSSVQRLPVKLL